jgi:HAD superfamily hydrolase (TIGR01548 family)
MREGSFLVFDMDGVLAEVSESYLAAVASTVRYFTGATVSRGTIEEYKQTGGWNNDWALAHKLVTDNGRSEVTYPEIVSRFQSLFLGTDGNGLITREKWLPADGLLPRLSQKYRLAVFTGRPRAEIDITLKRFVPEVKWDAIVADGDVAKPKPAPDGLLAIAALQPEAPLTYVGDNVDDARSARAAGVVFIGIAESHQSRLAQLLRDEGARSVIASVNEIEGVL